MQGGQPAQGFGVGGFLGGTVGVRFSGFAPDHSVDRGGEFQRGLSGPRVAELFQGEIDDPALGVMVRLGESGGLEGLPQEAGEAIEGGLHGRGVSGAQAVRR